MAFYTGKNSLDLKKKKRRREERKKGKKKLRGEDLWSTKR